MILMFYGATFSINCHKKKLEKFIGNFLVSALTKKPNGLCWLLGFQAFFYAVRTSCPNQGFPERRTKPEAGSRGITS